MSIAVPRARAVARARTSKAGIGVVGFSSVVEEEGGAPEMSGIEGIAVERLLAHAPLEV